MNKELPKAERTRQFIIEKTAGIFNTKGYAGTSIADLTNATGLTKGSIYGNFASKEEVALAVFDYNLSLLTNAIQTRMKQATTARDRLLAYTRVYHDLNQAKFPIGGCPVLNTAVEADDTNNLLRDRVDKTINAWKRTLVKIIREGIATGEFRSTADPETTALSIIALIEGGVMIAKATNTIGNLYKVLSTVETVVEQLKA